MRHADVFLGNVDFTLDESQLADGLARLGIDALDVKLPYTPGIAFITLRDNSEAAIAAALKTLDGARFQGRRVRAHRATR